MKMGSHMKSTFTGSWQYHHPALLWSPRTGGAQGGAKGVSGRWTDILMECGDKWALIGDRGG